MPSPQTQDLAVITSSSGHDGVDNADPGLPTASTYYVLPMLLRNWPYGPMVNPHARVADKECMTWLQTLMPLSGKMLKMFEKCEIGLLCASTWPRASPKVLRSCCELMSIFLIIDEHTDRCNAEEARAYCDVSMDAILDVNKLRPEGEPIIGEICRQFWQRATKNMYQATKERFVRYWKLYLDGAVVQASRRDDSRYICTIDELIAARQMDAGVYPCYTFVEASLGLAIPHEIMDHPTIASITRNAVDLVAYANDLFSYRKEVMTDSADYNSITVVMRDLNTDLAGAVQWISERHDEIVARFLKLRGDVVNKANFPSYGRDMDRQIEAYIDGLGQWIKGNEEWSLNCGRYFGSEGAEIKRTRMVILPQSQI